MGETGGGKGRRGGGEKGRRGGGVGEETWRRGGARGDEGETEVRGGDGGDGGGGGRGGDEGEARGGGWATSLEQLLVVGRGNIVTEEEDKLRCCGSFQKPSSVRRPTNRDANLTRVY
ncbi:unnamed protein product [Gadus morhua 'NCC']